MKHTSSLSVDYLGSTDCRSSQRASEDFDLCNGQCCLRQHLDKLPSSRSSSNNSVVDVVVAVFVVVVIVDVVVVTAVTVARFRLFLGGALPPRTLHRPNGWWLT